MSDLKLTEVSNSFKRISAIPALKKMTAYCEFRIIERRINGYLLFISIIKTNKNLMKNYTKKFKLGRFESITLFYFVWPGFMHFY